MNTGNNMDLQTLYKIPRMSSMELNITNSVEGLHALVQQFYKPHFKMVEVGSFEGVSTVFFSKFVDTVYSVDCYDYKVPPEGRIPDHDQLFREAEQIFISRTKDIKNIIKIKKTSIEAAKDFPDRSLDAVYIDAEHDEESIREDIRAWRSKIKFGGVLSGHDFSPTIQRILNEEGLIKITLAPDTSWAAPIPSIALVATASTKIPETIEAIKKCQAQMEFTESILFTHEDIEAEGIRVVNIDKLDYWGYNEFVAMKLWQYIGTDYVLLVQNDSWILNGKKWRDEWFNFDYIGSAWPVPPENDKVNYRTPRGDLVRVGNGGFSLRSRKLLRAPTILNLNFNEKWAGSPTEDGWLCVYHKERLEKSGIRFAPVEEAVRFARELYVPELVDKDTFGFHRYL